MQEDVWLKNVVREWNGIKPGRCSNETQHRVTAIIFRHVEPNQHLLTVKQLFCKSLRKFCLPNTSWSQEKKRAYWLVWHSGWSSPAFDLSTACATKLTAAFWPATRSRNLSARCINFFSSRSSVLTGMPVHWLTTFKVTLQCNEVLFRS